MSKALEKYNIPLKKRVKVAPTGNWQVIHTSTVRVAGKDVDVLRVPSTKVNETARKVILKHNEVIKRLAKR